MKKSAFVLTLLASLGFVTVVVAASRSLPNNRNDVLPGNESPNVLIVITDDQRLDLEVMSTVKALQQVGRDYPNAYVTTPSCCPSRASIMTGRYAHNHGVLDNTLAGELDHRTTIQYYLRRAGYRTGYVGKFLNQWRLGRRPPFFTDWVINTPRLTNDEFYYGIRANVNGDVRRINRYSTDFFGDQALRFLLRAEADRDAQPWLLYMAPNAPHAEFEPSQTYADAPVPRWDPPPSVVEFDRSDKPPWVKELYVGVRRGRWVRRQQFRMLMSVDDQVERLLVKLQELEETNTLVVFISDNGYSWGDHGIESKSSPYRESVRVPLVVWWPGRLDGGSVDERLVANIDLAPTIIEATEASTAGGPPMDGRSLLDPTWIRERLLLEYRAHGNRTVPDWASVVSPQWQYTEYYERGELSFREYYDLAKDPYQLDNLWTGDPDDALAIAPVVAELAQDRRCVGAACP